VKLLVVEDEPGIAAMLQLGLQEAGFEVQLAADGLTGLRMAREGGYGLIVLDIMLPGIDGWSVCRSLREAGDTTPILMLTARDTVEDRIRGLEGGADDYLPKPFDFKELLARVEALSRREVERQDERRQRERTEAMLRVLSQATAGIVHDLGNPLASVQMGVATLETFLEDGCTDPEVLREFIRIAQEGTEMLNYLRYSLMEEVRVLEGRSIPVELQRTSLRPVIEAAARCQRVHFTGGREVSLVGEDQELVADGMRLTTVFMNLIGNALKYSDGEVRITWRTHKHHVLVAVLDRGMESRGITREEAGQLFLPFGRLRVHAHIEGTGLGLLSARRITEAHHGELYLEGYRAGTPASERFTTAAGAYPSMLEEEFRTAFVVGCPLAGRRPA
jgi:DNA-binding response OmpR family regulator